MHTVQNPSPQNIKDATIFLEHEVFSRIVVIATRRLGSFLIVHSTGGIFVSAGQ